MENSVEGKPFINRESKSLELKIYLYRSYDEHEAHIGCNTTTYLSILMVLMPVRVLGLSAYMAIMLFTTISAYIILFLA